MFERATRAAEEAVVAAKKLLGGMNPYSFEAQILFMRYRRLECALEAYRAHPVASNIVRFARQLRWCDTRVARLSGNCQVSERRGP